MSSTRRALLPASTLRSTGCGLPTPLAARCQLLAKEGSAAAEAPVLRVPRFISPAQLFSTFLPSLAALNVSAVSLEDVSAAMLLHHPRLEPGSVYRGLVAACRSLKIGFQRTVRMGMYAANRAGAAAARGDLHGDATRALYLQATQILGGDVGAQPDDAPARNQRLRAAR